MAAPPKTAENSDSDFSVFPAAKNVAVCFLDNFAA